jgi:hypothetical protein
MLSNMRLPVLFAGLLLVAGGFPLTTFAQDGEVLEIEAEAPMAEGTMAKNQGDLAAEGVAPAVTAQAEQPVSDGKPVFRPEEYASLVFTFWEQDAIELARRAANGDGDTRGVTDYEIKESQKRDDLTEKIKPPPEQREIRLAGILFNEKDSWTIWLNEKRVTPEALPKEVIDLKVYKSYIEFKWFDDYTNRIYPIRLRPHQRFNIDTRIFLPG